MIAQIQKSIDMFFMVNEWNRKRLFSIVCLNEVRQRFECLEHDIDYLGRAIEKYSEFNESFEVRQRISLIDSELITIQELISFLLDSKKNDVYGEKLEPYSIIGNRKKRAIINFLFKLVRIMENEFEKQKSLSFRACEIQRGEKEIEELRIVLQQLDAYLDFIQNHMPSTQKEIRVFIDTIILFFNCIACHVGFLVWLADFWVNCRFLQLHDE